MVLERSMVMEAENEILARTEYQPQPRPIWSERRPGRRNIAFGPEWSASVFCAETESQLSRRNHPLCLLDLRTLRPPGDGQPSPPRRPKGALPAVAAL